MKIETGVMVMKNGKGWGTCHDDGRSSSSGWRDPEVAEIHDPRFCKKPTDVTWEGSFYTKELATAKLVHVRRTTTVEVLETPDPRIPGTPVS